LPDLNKIGSHAEGREDTMDLGGKNSKLIFLNSGIEKLKQNEIRDNNIPNT